MTDSTTTKKVEDDADMEMNAKNTNDEAVSDTEMNNNIVLKAEDLLARAYKKQQDKINHKNNK